MKQNPSNHSREPMTSRPAKSQMNGPAPDTAQRIARRPLLKVLVASSAVLAIIMLLASCATIRPTPTPEVIKIYWSDTGTGKIQRANPNGSSVEDVVTGLGTPEQIAIDARGGKMYWTDSKTSRIQRANLDGSNVEDLVRGVPSLRGIALDIGGGKMYWVGIRFKIQRANLDGTNVEDLVATGLRFAWLENGGKTTFVSRNIAICLALDLKNSKMYWTDNRRDTIQRANLDGSGVEDIVTGLNSPYGITIDSTNDKIYWTDRGTRKIQRANLDGSGIEDLIVGSGLVEPKAIALDLVRGKMYWVDETTCKVQRANLDGSGIEDLVTGLVEPPGFALQIE